MKSNAIIWAIAWTAATAIALTVALLVFVFGGTTADVAQSMRADHQRQPLKRNWVQVTERPARPMKPNEIEFEFEKDDDAEFKRMVEAGTAISEVEVRVEELVGERTLEKQAKALVREKSHDPSSVSFLGIRQLGIVRSAEQLDAGDYYTVIVEYRAKNVFGALQRTEAAVLFDIETNHPEKDNHDGKNEVLDPYMIVSPDSIQTQETRLAVEKFLGF